MYFWFPKMFGKMLNEVLGKIHFWFTIIFFNLVFTPMFIIGMSGHMRRIYNPLQYDFLKPLQPINQFITYSAIMLFLGQLPFIFNFFWSIFKGKKAGDNPWKANTLEWATTSPPPHENFDEDLVVYSGPYNFTKPGQEEDFQMQCVPVKKEPVS